MTLATAAYVESQPSGYNKAVFSPAPLLHVGAHMLTIFNEVVSSPAVDVLVRTNLQGVVSWRLNQ